MEEPALQRALEAAVAEALGAHDGDDKPHRVGRRRGGEVGHEPFVLFGFLAAFTSLELVNGVIIAPQRQTALIAKQAAEVDLLTEGRFRLGLGVGWNPVEYEALVDDFGTHGARLDEQIPLLRRLWTEASVTHEGRSTMRSRRSPPPRSRPAVTRRRSGWRAA